MCNCVICCESINNEFTTCCGHKFCENCIIDWCKRKNICPLCRKKNILFYCKKCNKIKSIEKRKDMCKSCVDNLVYENIDKKFEIDNMIKLQKDLKRRIKKLSLYKRIILKLKIRKLLKLMKKTGITFIKLIRIITGLCKVDSAVGIQYHGLLTIIFGIAGLSMLGGSIPVLPIILIFLALFNFGTVWSFSIKEIIKGARGEQTDFQLYIEQMGDN